MIKTILFLTFCCMLLHITLCSPRKHHHVAGKKMLLERKSDDLLEKIKTAEKKEKDKIDAVTDFMKNAIEELKKNGDGKVEQDENENEEQEEHEEQEVQQTPKRNLLKERFPFTLWCGKGDGSSDGIELGELNCTDACCRAHDKCTHNIHKNKRRWGFENHQTYTLSACTCDDTFNQCLQDVNMAKFSNDLCGLADVSASSAVGQFFFDMLDMECLKNAEFYSTDEPEEDIKENEVDAMDTPLYDDTIMGSGDGYSAQPPAISLRDPKDFPFWG